MLVFGVDIRNEMVEDFDVLLWCRLRVVGIMLYEYSGKGVLIIVVLLIELNEVFFMCFFKKEIGISLCIILVINKFKSSYGVDLMKSVRKFCLSKMIFDIVFCLLF